MATLVLTNAYVSLGGTDMSTKVRSVTLNLSAELLDDTAMGDTTRSRKPGLKDWSADVEFIQDFADDDLDEDLFALMGTTFAVAIRPVNTTIGAGNPEYQGTGVLESYTPIGNAVGELAMAPVRILAAGTLVRDITP